MYLFKDKVNLLRLEYFFYYKLKEYVGGEDYMNILDGFNKNDLTYPIC